MFVLMRAVTYGTLFVGFLLVFLPGRVLEWSGVRRPASLGLTQVLGLVVVVLGAGLALWCILTFAFVGKGTPAPWDPPRRLVVRGPYRFVRNPMISGVILILIGECLGFRSWPLAEWAAGFAVINMIYIPLLEESQLKWRFGEEYQQYKRNVPRLFPRLRPWRGV